MYRMINHLDAPKRYFTLTYDEVCIAALGLMLMILSNHKLIVVLLGGLLLTLLRRLKQGKGPQYLWVLAYWYLPSYASSWMLMKLPPSHLRVWQV